MKSPRFAQPGSGIGHRSGRYWLDLEKLAHKLEVVPICGGALSIAGIERQETTSGQSTAIPMIGTPQLGPGGMADPFNRFQAWGSLYVS